MPETQTRQRQRCVRCGHAPRMVADATDGGFPFLCWACAADPKTMTEVAEAEAHGTDYLARRRYAIEHLGWAGGWGAQA